MITSNALHQKTELGVGACGFPSPQRAGLFIRNDLQKRLTETLQAVHERKTTDRREKIT